MKIIFKPRFAPCGVFAPRAVFAPKVNLLRKRKEGNMGLLAPVRNAICLLGGAGLGAGLMYLLDPEHGRRRRALLRDQAAQALHHGSAALDRGLRDLEHRASGCLIELASRFSPETVSDAVLLARIRTALGRCVAHPHAVEVAVTEGQVRLSGHILRRDLPHLIARVRAMKGVREIVDQLAVHEEPGQVPDLQGKVRAEQPRLRLEPSWTPATRLGIAAAGGLLALYGTSRRGLAGIGLTTIGLSVLGRSLRRQPHSFAADDRLERGVDLQKTINIDAPLERVFKLLARPENFPLFMQHVREVKKLDGSGYRWTVLGPGGALAHWDTEITRLIDNELLEWKTLPGSAVEHAGLLRVDPTPYGGTRVHIRVSYRPPLGAVGGSLGEFFSLYPKHLLDDDLRRFKSLLETGKTTVHHHRVRLDDMATC